ncbi:MAG: hypothetical protein R2713_09805 [Ilumatobacteraceae bacterium]
MEVLVAWLSKLAALAGARRRRPSRNDDEPGTGPGSSNDVMTRVGAQPAALIFIKRALRRAAWFCG